MIVERLLESKKANLIKTAAEMENDKFLWNMFYV